MRGYYLVSGGLDVCIFVPYCHMYFSTTLWKKLDFCIWINPLTAISSSPILCIWWHWIVIFHFSKISFSTCSILMSLFDMLGRRVWSSSGLSSQALSNSAHYFLTRCALNVPSVLSVCGEFCWGNVFHAQKLIHIYERFCVIKFPVPLPWHISFSPVQHLTDWLPDQLTNWPTDPCTICFILPSYKCCFLPKNKVLYSHRNCWLGNRNYWTCSIYGCSCLQFERLLQFTNLSQYSVLTVMIVWATSSRLCWKQCRRTVRSARGVRGTGSAVAVGYSAVMRNSILVVVILP